MDKTGRGVGVGVGDQWVKLGDWELRDHMTELDFDWMGESLLKFKDVFAVSLDVAIVGFSDCFFTGQH